MADIPGDLREDAFGLPPLMLEQKFPHVLRRISTLWGEAQLDNYLDGLLGPLRRGTFGFPKEALAEIVRIKLYCREQGISNGDKPPLRERLLPWLNYDQHIYPYALEAEAPELLAGLLPLLGAPALGAHIDALLSPAKQLHHRFSEAALIELMTLKAIHRTRLATARTTHAEADKEHHAALVLERHGRK